MEGKEWGYEVPGIPDSYFERIEGIPMTKREIRVLSLSELRIGRGMSVIDIGCGTGSVTVEASNLIGSEGRIVAVDINGEAAALTKRNCSRLCKFRNFTVLNDDVYAFENDEQFSRVFVGGATEDMKRLFDVIGRISSEGARVVVNAIQIHTVDNALREMEKRSYRDISVMLAQIAGGMKTKEGYAMISRNPVFIISGERP